MGGSLESGMYKKRDKDDGRQRKSILASEL